jgi:hypothetical protein
MQALYRQAILVEELRSIVQLGEVQDKLIKETEDFIGVDSEGWVHADRYEEVMALFKRLKEEAETATKMEEDREEMIEIKEHWFWDDIDETRYR